MDIEDENVDVSKALKIIKPIQKSTQKRKASYEVISKDKLSVLCQFFENKNYPSKEDMLDLAQKLSFSFAKIEYWFKNQRKKKSLKKKNVFSPEQKEILMKEFLKNPYPSEEKYLEISNHLSCELNTIKNWFSYKRKVIIKLKSTEGASYLRNSFEEILSPRNKRNQENSNMIAFIEKENKVEGEEPEEKEQTPFSSKSL